MMGLEELQVGFVTSALWDCAGWAVVSWCCRLALRWSLSSCQHLNSSLQMNSTNESSAISFLVEAPHHWMIALVTHLPSAAGWLHTSGRE